LANAQELASWARSAGFDDIVPSNWHVTIAKTHETVDLGAMKPDASSVIVPASRHRLVARRGEFIALMFRSATIATRHREFRAAGAGWEHRSFRPHVTIAINDRRELEGVVPFAGELVFGGEIWCPPMGAKLLGSAAVGLPSSGD
jgi:hypothetical protein